MKHFLTSLLSLFIFCQIGFGQSVPQGMKYQAVARDLNGQVMSDQTLYIKITLYSDPVKKDISYTELHKVTTGTIGLFDLTIGAGQAISGTFQDVPWSSEDVWIEVAVQTTDATDYVTISNSRMLSVPYAFHAATASEITGLNRNNNPGIPSQTWSLFGNSNSDATKDKLGTTDYEDLVIVTNDIERLRILANGDINIARSLNIGENLTVEQNTYLNVRNGETINYGDFTVENQSSTLLSGTLTVDHATDLNSSLNVDGVTNLNSSLSVNNMSPTTLTGTLRVEKDATFKEHVVLDNAAHNSTLPTNGALVVNGGVGIGKNLNVGGDSKFGGAVTFAGKVTMTDLTESTSTTTGALTVSGGVGIGKRINVGGDAAMEQKLTVTGATLLNSTLGVTGITSLNNTTESTLSTNGGLVVAGGVGIAKNLNVAGTTILSNALTVRGASLSGHAATFESSGSNGIKIQVNAGTPTNSNQFVTFVNAAGGRVGSIKGESNSTDLANNDEYQAELSALDWEVAFSTIDEATAIADEIVAIADVVAASTSSTLCVGLGACVTTPIPSLIVASVAAAVVATANLVSRSIQLGFAIDERAGYVSDYAAQMGVTYTSGSADYAEYLPKLNMNEKFTAGDVVGLKHGFITKNTEGADRIMVISMNPIVLGKVPADGNDEHLEMVAFLGQIPVKVMGSVELGDYILSSGYNNGTGIARNPKNMTISDYDRILGVSWEAATENKLNLVNVAVGLNTNDLTGVILQQAETIKKQEEVLNSLNNQMAQTQDILSTLVPGFKESIGDNAVTIITPTRQAGQSTDAHAEHDYQIMSPEGEDVIYFDVTREQLEAGIAMAEEISRKAGVDMDTHPFWKRLSSDEAYKQETMRDLQNKLKTSFHTHQQLNSSK